MERKISLGRWGPNGFQPYTLLFSGLVENIPLVIKDIDDTNERVANKGETNLDCFVNEMQTPTNKWVLLPGHGEKPAFDSKRQLQHLGGQSPAQELSQWGCREKNEHPPLFRSRGITRRSRNPEVPTTSDQLEPLLDCCILSGVLTKGVEELNSLVGEL